MSNPGLVIPPVVGPVNPAAQITPQLPTAPGQMNVQDFIKQILAQYPLNKAVPADAGELSPADEKKAETSVKSASDKKSTTSPAATTSAGAGPQTLTDGILNMGQIMPVVHAMMATGDHTGLGDLLTGKSKFSDTGLGKAAAAIEKLGPMLAGL